MFYTSTGTRQGIASSLADAWESCCYLNATASEYLYRGKLQRRGNPATAGELHQEIWMEWYDYGARMYDPQIGRWSVIDKYSEKAYDQTPYRYGASNPLNTIDVKGNFEFKDAANYPRLAFLLQYGIQKVLSDTSNMLENTLHLPPNKRVKCLLLVMYVNSKKVGQTWLL